MGFADNLRIARKAKGYTQAELADLLTAATNASVYRSSVTNWEKGKHEPSLSTCAAAAEILDVTLDQLISDTPLVPTCMYEITTHYTDRDGNDHTETLPPVTVLGSAIQDNPVLNMYVERLQAMSEEDLSHAVVVGCQDSERLQLLYQLTNANTDVLRLLSLMTDLTAEEIQTLYTLARLDTAKLKALCILSGINV